MNLLHVGGEELAAHDDDLELEGVVRGEAKGEGEVRVATALHVAGGSCDGCSGAADKYLPAGLGSLVEGVGGDAAADGDSAAMAHERIVEGDVLEEVRPEEEHILRGRAAEVVMPRGLYDDAEVVCLGEAHAGLDVCGGGGIDGVEGHISLAADGGVVEAERWWGGEIVLLPVDLEHVAWDGVSEDSICPLGIGTSSQETVAELHRGHNTDQAAW